MCYRNLPKIYRAQPDIYRMLTFCPVHPSCYVKYRENKPMTWIFLSYPLRWLSGVICLKSTWFHQTSLFNPHDRYCSLSSVYLYRYWVFQKQMNLLHIAKSVNSGPRRKISAIWLQNPNNVPRYYTWVMYMGVDNGKCKRQIFVRSKICGIMSFALGQEGKIKFRQEIAWAATQAGMNTMCPRKLRISVNLPMDRRELGC